ncbi:MAG: hypothetical protein ACE5H3_09120, partial [Planctomycetota bacterium]
MKVSGEGGRLSRKRGSAIVIVLLALALLLSLGIPFLYVGRLRSQASRDAFERARARVALGSASEYATLREARSHPSADSTPLWDARSEWDPGEGEKVLPQELGGGWEKSTEAWGFEVEDLQGRISLASAPAMVLQNLLHPSFLTGKNSPGEPRLNVTSTAGFPGSGLLLVGSEWVRYQSRTGTTFEEIAFARATKETDRPPSLVAGTAVVDARVFNLVLARQREGRQRPPEFLDELFESDPLNAGTLGPGERAFLARFCGLETGSFGSPAWEPATLLKREINPEAPERIEVFDGFLFNPGSVVRVEPGQGEPFDRVVIASLPNRGLAELAGGLPAGLASFSTRIRPLRREPVDLNSAVPEVLQAVALGVRFRGPDPAPVVTSRQEPPVTRDRWISPARARAFAEAVAQARPLRGPEDLWARVLAPLVKAGRLAEVDAWALQLNGLDPNHGSLAGSTLPFAYRTGNRYLERVNAAVRSRRGSPLARASR